MVNDPTHEEQAPGTGLDPLVANEIDNYEKEAIAFLDGGGMGDDFRPFRLQQGVYGQRQDDAQMIRIKIPHGSMTAEQLDAIGHVADKYTPRKVGHVTTRQAIQLHYVPLKNTLTVLRILAEAGLTTREACGNTVRNVSADPTTGLCVDTVFDGTPYAEATTRFFLRNPICQKLPRKFKIAFSACPHDRGLVPIHDLGATAVIKDRKRGCRVTVGGGLGASPVSAELLDEFVPEHELLRVSEAVIRIFDRMGNRKNRNKARIKFVVKNLGIEEFRRVVKEEIAALPPAEKQGYLEPDWSFLEEEASHPSAASLGQNGHAAQPGFEAWKRTNALPQAQSGFSMVYVLLPIGDMTVDQFHQLADISRKYAGGKIRTAVNQNMVLRWIHDEDLPGLHADLIECGLAEDGALTLSDVMTCPGTDTCSLGVTSSKGLGMAIRERLAASNGDYKSDPLVEQIRTAAILHDVGKIGIPDSILTKPGRLTEEEFEIIKQHPQIAMGILGHVSFLEAELPMILHHHERYDGTGYPAGLVGTDIPLGARVIAVADAVEVMLARRSYKNPYDVARVRAELREQAGKQFDPTVAAATIEWMNEPQAARILQAKSANAGLVRMAKPESANQSASLRTTV